MGTRPFPLKPGVPELEPIFAHRVFNEGKLTFRADFDSSNLNRIRQSGTNMDYGLWTAPDCDGKPEETGHRSWFYFAVAGQARGDFASFTVMNMNKQSKLYGQDYRPLFWNRSMGAWERCRMPVTYSVVEPDFQLRFKHRFEDDLETFFAFAFPFSYSENQKMLGDIDAAYSRHESIYFKRELLVRSLEGRHCELLTITSQDGDTGRDEDPLPSLFPEAHSQGRARIFEGKKVFFVSSRVHPGETPGSHMFNGLLEFLLRTDDARAEALRKIYVFKLVPILNPDGVARGHYRQDTTGKNLNRSYIAPSVDDAPTIYAAKQVLLRYAAREELDMYIDLHAHANKRGCFAFGNALEGRKHVSNVLFAKLCALNCPHFDFTACNFSEKNMKSRDKMGDCKEGSGRVALYRETGLTNIYTVEVNYNSSRIMNMLAPAHGGDPRASPPSRARDPVKFSVPVFQGMGRALAVAALDMIDANPWTRLGNSELKGLKGVVGWVCACIRAQMDRSDPGRAAIDEGQFEEIVGGAAGGGAAREEEAERKPRGSKAAADAVLASIGRRDPKDVRSRMLLEWEEEEQRKKKDLRLKEERRLQQMAAVKDKMKQLALERKQTASIRSKACMERRQAEIRGHAERAVAKAFKGGGGENGGGLLPPAGTGGAAGGDGSRRTSLGQLRAAKQTARTGAPTLATALKDGLQRTFPVRAGGGGKGLLPKAKEPASAVRTDMDMIGAGGGYEAAWGRSGQQSVKADAAG